MAISKAKIDSFIREWKSVRGKTYEFVETVPESKMTWKPHGDLGTFGMQLRHIGVSQRAYIAGLKSGKVDFSDKSFEKNVEVEKEKAVAFMKKMDMELIVLLDSMEFKDAIEFHDGVYGKKTVDAETVLNWMLQHETYHQGVLTCYGRLAGLGKFRMM